MSMFQEVAENPILGELLDKYSDLMERDNYYFTHSSKLKFIFRYAADNIPSEKIMILANYLDSSRIMSKLQIADESANALTGSITDMANKCPLEDKLRLYSLLDSSGTISAGYKTSYSSINGDYIISAFKGVGTEKALAVLKYSDSWL